MKALTHYTRRLRRHLLAAVCACAVCTAAATIPPVCDMERAREICDSLPLEGPEGIWLYPDDHVTVLVTHQERTAPTSFTAYDIRAVQSDDGRIAPGDLLGTLTATATPGLYLLEIATSICDSRPLRTQRVQVKTADAGNSLILTKGGPKLNFRISLSPNTLLPGLWKIFRISGSLKGGSDKVPPGMVRIYPRPPRIEYL